MSVLSRPYFHDEAAAFQHVEEILWPTGPVCPKCGNVDKHYKLAGVRTKPSKKNPNGVERHGLYKCAACRSQFTVRMGTIFEESHIPLHKWLQAIHLLCSSKKGISSTSCTAFWKSRSSRRGSSRTAFARPCARMTSRPWAATAWWWKPTKPTSVA
jgi:transposase-like protein